MPGEHQDPSGLSLYRSGMETPEYTPYIQPRPQPRFFGLLLANVFPSLLPNIFGRTSFVSSTPTTTITQYCTESSAFVTTTNCSAAAGRRRRGVMIEEDDIQPSLVLPLYGAFVVLIIYF